MHRSLGATIHSVARGANPMAPDNEGRVGPAQELQPGPHEVAGGEVTPVPTVSGRKPRKPTEVDVLGAAAENRPADCDRQPHIISATNVSKHATEQVRSLSSWILQLPGEEAVT